MKLILEDKQFERIVQLITEGKYSRSLLATRKSGISTIFPQSAMLSNPTRFRHYELEKKGIEEKDIKYNPIEDNSDPQL